MNDEFMTQLREEPRAEFVDALYERISQQPQPRFSQTPVKKLTFRNAAIAFAFLFFIAACVYVVSEKRWDKVGNIWVNVQRMLPPPNYTSPEGEPETQFLELECVSISEAKQILRFDLRAPTWIPEGFTLVDEVCGIDRISEEAGLYWAGPNKDTGISLMSRNLRWFDPSTQQYEIRDPAMSFPVGRGSYEEVQVKGQPAVLVHGDWEEPWGTEEMLNHKSGYKWDQNRALQLYWVDGEFFYHLFTRADLSPEDLIKMAESVQ